jgi:hypothetical protein
LVPPVGPEVIGNGGRRPQQEKASASFLKKRSKKLLLTAGCGTAVANARRSKSFFASFFSKKEVLTYPYAE